MPILGLITAGLLVNGRPFPCNKPYWLTVHFVTSAECPVLTLKRIMYSRQEVTKNAKGGRGFYDKCRSVAATGQSSTTNLCSSKPIVPFIFRQKVRFKAHLNLAVCCCCPRKMPTGALKLHYHPLVQVHLNSVCKNIGEKRSQLMPLILSRDHKLVTNKKTFKRQWTHSSNCL